MLVVKHIPGDDNKADIFTKNTLTATFNKHVELRRVLECSSSILFSSLFTTVYYFK
jgi:hypothetical protein